MNHPLNTAAFYHSKPFWEDRQSYLLEGRHYSKVSFLLRDSLKKRMESLLIGDRSHLPSQLSLKEVLLVILGQRVGSSTHNPCSKHNHTKK